MNQTKLFFVGGACLALAGARRVGAEPFDESRGYMFYAITQPQLIKREIVPPTTALPVDDAIIAIAKAGDFNLIADASRISKMQTVAPFPATPIARQAKWTPRFYDVFEDMAEANQLSELRYDATTFLLWKRPDIVETARELLAANKLRLTEPVPSQKTVVDALNKAKADREFEEPEAGPAVIRMGDVSLPQRQTLVDLLRYGILRPEWKRELYLASDDFWKTVRVKAVPSQTYEETGNILVYVSGQDEQGHSLPFFRVMRWLLPLGDSPAFEFEAPTTEIALQQAVLTPEEPAPTEELTPAELEAAAELGAPISLETKRRPLKEVLSNAAKQGGVALSVSGDAASLPITARVAKMPLHELMGSLSRLTGASWQKNGGGYILHSRALARWQQLLLQSGEGDFEGHGIEAQYTDGEVQPMRDLEQSIAEEVTNLPPAPEGVPFSSLSAQHQTQLKKMAQDAAATALVNAYSQAFVLTSPGGMLHLSHDPGLTTWNIQLLKGDNRESVTGTTVSRPTTPERVVTPDGAAPNPEIDPNASLAPNPDVNP